MCCRICTCFLPFNPISLKRVTPIHFKKIIGQCFLTVASRLDCNINETHEKNIYIFHEPSHVCSPILNIP